MIRVEVASVSIDERQGVSGKTQKPYHMREQAAYAHLMDKHGKPQKYPVAFTVPLELEQPPYQPGMYTLDPASMFVGDFKKLELGRVKLVPLPQK